MYEFGFTLRNILQLRIFLSCLVSDNCWCEILYICCVGLIWFQVCVWKPKVLWKFVYWRSHHGVQSLKLFFDAR